MKMAKASEADMSMAIEMAQALDALTNRWTPMMPEAIDQGGEEENERFDIDDETQCRRVVEYLLELADRASLFRVVFGMAVLLDPQNEIVDPAADHLATHPKFDAAAKDAERYRLLRRGQHWSVVDGIGDTLRADALRLRWLAEDHADPEVRERVRSICQSIPTRSISGVRLDIDANMGHGA